MTAGSNWAGTYAYRARALHRPETLEELQELVARAPRLRVLGSRHSFSDIADSEELVTLDALPAEIVVDGGTVTCGGAVRYGELAETLHAEGVALHNLASLPHISVAGAVATATHGSGDASGNLATAVAGLELVTADGELLDRGARRRGLRRPRRRPRRARRRHARHARRRARLRDRPARLRGPDVGRAVRALRRDHEQRATA